MKRPDRLVALSFVVAILAAFGLFVVYLRGGQTQLEGALLFLTLGGIGVGLLVWAKRLMPHIVDETQSRHHAPVSEHDQEEAAETVMGGVDELKRRTFLSRLLVGAAGALGLAALFPIRSLGEVPGEAVPRLDHPRLEVLVDQAETVAGGDQLEGQREQRAPFRFVQRLQARHVALYEGTRRVGEHQHKRPLRHQVPVARQIAERVGKKADVGKGHGADFVADFRTLGSVRCFDGRLIGNRLPRQQDYDSSDTGGPKRTANQ